MITLNFNNYDMIQNGKQANKKEKLYSINLHFMAENQFLG